MLTGCIIPKATNKEAVKDILMFQLSWCKVYFELFTAGVLIESRASAGAARTKPRPPIKHEIRSLTVFTEENNVFFPLQIILNPN